MGKCLGPTWGGLYRSPPGLLLACKGTTASGPRRQACLPSSRPPLCASPSDLAPASQPGGNDEDRRVTRGRGWPCLRHPVRVLGQRPRVRYLVWSDDPPDLSSRDSTSQYPVDVARCLVDSRLGVRVPPPAPRCWARHTAATSVRERKPRLRNTLARWCSTVLGLRYRAVESPGGRLPGQHLHGHGRVGRIAELGAAGRHRRPTTSGCRPSPSPVWMRRTRHGLLLRRGCPSGPRAQGRPGRPVVSAGLCPRARWRPRGRRGGR
jgi:hypothetical protein